MARKFSMHKLFLFEFRWFSWCKLKRRHLLESTTATQLWLHFSVRLNFESFVKSLNSCKNEMRLTKIVLEFYWTWILMVDSTRRFINYAQWTMQINRIRSAYGRSILITLATCALFPYLFIYLESVRPWHVSLCHPVWEMCTIFLQKFHISNCNSYQFPVHSFSAHFDLLFWIFIAKIESNLLWRCRINRSKWTRPMHSTWYCWQNKSTLTDQVCVCK